MKAKAAEEIAADYNHNLIWCGIYIYIYISHDIYYIKAQTAEGVAAD